MEKHSNKIFYNGILLLVSIFCINMGNDQTSTTPKLYHTELERNEKSYNATIHENGKARKVKDINFTGKTSINKIKRRDEKVNMDIDFANIRELQVIQARHITEDGDEYTLASYTSISGETVDGLLFPKDLILSAIGVESGEEGMNLYWPMHLINKIVIDHSGSTNITPDMNAINLEPTPAEELKTSA